MGKRQGGALRNRSHSTWAVRWITSGGLQDLVQTAAKKIDIAIANKCTVCYLQEVGRFYTDSAALVTVSFETQSYELCYAVVQVMNGGNYDMLLLNKKDTHDFINVLRSAHSLVDDHQRQVVLFK